MSNLQLSSHPAVLEKFTAYPEYVRSELFRLRALIIEEATGLENVQRLEESLKWGEPSYKSNIGSTIRMDWKAKSPHYYALYFRCTTTLVATFRACFGEQLTFEKNRAIHFNFSQDIPVDIVRICIRAALRYHKVKGMTNLGIEGSSLNQYS
ncbi:MAG: DUF1801 domain-containing protein [Bacteroidota bacterium]